MRAFDRLLPAEEDDQIIETSRDYTRCFWISYSAFMIVVGALSMWAFFKYIVMA